MVSNGTQIPVSHLKVVQPYLSPKGTFCIWMQHRQPSLSVYVILLCLVQCDISLLDVSHVVDCGLFNWLCRVVLSQHGAPCSAQLLLHDAMQAAAICRVQCDLGFNRDENISKVPDATKEELQSSKDSPSS